MDTHSESHIHIKAQKDRGVQCIKIDDVPNYIYTHYIALPALFPVPHPIPYCVHINKKCRATTRLACRQQAGTQNKPKIKVSSRCISNKVSEVKMIDDERSREETEQVLNR
jgi:hypothetical protein